MLIGRRLDEEKGIDEHLLTFHTGKEVVLTPAEFKELKNRITLLRAEYKMRRKAGKDTKDWDWLR